MSELQTSVSIAALGAALQKQVSHASPTDMPFLRLQKGGGWIFGADDVEVQDGSKWAINPHSLCEGFINWGDGEVLGEKMALMTGTPIILADLPQVAGSEKGWQKQVGFQLKCLNGEDAGTQVLFKTSSKGGQKSVRTSGGVIPSILAQMAVDPVNVIPIVQLDETWYKHKQFGKIFNPIFKIVEWAPITAEAPAASAEASASIAEREAEPAAAATAPTKRRRPMAT